MRLPRRRERRLAESRHADAAAIPAWGLADEGLAPWVGVAALSAAVLLVALLALRAITRTRRSH